MVRGPGQPAGAGIVTQAVGAVGTGDGYVISGRIKTLSTSWHSSKWLLIAQGAFIYTIRSLLT